MAKRAHTDRQIVAQNRKARHNYFIEDTFEAGLILAGTEVKSLRAGKSNISDAYAAEREGGIYLFNAYIPEYQAANRFNHEPRRPRQLLLHKREIDRLLGAIKEKGITLVPLSLYFNSRGIAKVELGVAKGKRQYDKRETEKKRDWERQKARLIREMG